jgi:hypothetical protein
MTHPLDYLSPTPSENFFFFNIIKLALPYSLVFDAATSPP